MSKKTYPLLYAAYGANTNQRHMATRCPTAVYVGNAEIADYRLIFRSVADVIPVRGQSVVVAMWEIMPSDERALDSFEGYPHHYTKHYARIKHKGKNRLMMFYVMAGDRRDRHEPPSGYEHTLREGYKQCGMDPSQIDAAIRDAQNSERRQQRYNGSWLSKEERDARKPAVRSDYGRLMGRVSGKPSKPATPRATRDMFASDAEQFADDSERYADEYERTARLREMFPEYPDWFLKESGYFKAFD